MNVTGTVKAVYSPENGQDPDYINEKQMILTARGSKVSALKQLAVGDEVNITLSVSDLQGHTEEWRRVQTAIGGNIVYVQNGVLTGNGLESGYPTTLLGYDNSGKLIMLTMNGRRQGGTGGSGPRLAQLCRDLNLYSAFILDGGGSMTMVVNDGTGYKPVSQFGQIAAADMNYGAYELRNGERNFLFCSTVKSQTGENEGQTGDAKKFIGDLKVFSADTVERTKALITTASGNFYAFDQNLGTDKSPCYIGYSLTDVEDNAVTDIRLFAGENATSLSVGGAEYTLSGTLPTGEGIYISRSKLAGTPIGPELSSVLSPEEAPEGWEPVVHFSGAPVAQFGPADHRFAIYFEPKVKYTEGELYVGGFCFYQADYQCWLYSGDDSYLGADDKTQRRESVDEMISALRWQKGGIATVGDAIPDTASLTESFSCWREPSSPV